MLALSAPRASLALRRAIARALLALVVVAGCGSGGQSGGAGGGGAGGRGDSGISGGVSGGAGTGAGGRSSSGSGGSLLPGSGGAPGRGGTSGGGSAADVARKLGRTPHFLVGMGNDLDNDHAKDGAYTLGVTLDLHYAYMVGLPGQGGWPDWNPNGSFVNVLSDSADAKGVTPMYTLYAMAAIGDGNLSGLNMDTFMRPYWDGVRLLFQRLAMFGKPALVHVEPDFWAYAQQRAKGDPATVAVHVKGLVPECADQPDDLAGFGRCLLKLARALAPQAIIGFHASRWAGDTKQTVSFLNGVGAGEADVIVEDMLDRDAGCYEAKGSACGGAAGPWYWDESNKTSPNFHDYLAWAKAIGDGLHRPVLWWQVPFGVPSATPGGTSGHYRDNRVHYIFSHVEEFVAAGGLGVTFGTGAGEQTYITTDGGQFRDAVTAYFASPVALP